MQTSKTQKTLGFRVQKGMKMREAVEKTEVSVRRAQGHPSKVVTPQSCCAACFKIVRLGTHTRRLFDYVFSVGS